MQQDRTQRAAQSPTPGSAIPSEGGAVWQQALEHLPLGVAILDSRTGCTLWINSALRALLDAGIGSSDVLGESPSCYLPGLEQQAWDAALNSMDSRAGGNVPAPGQRLQFAHHATRNIAYWEWDIHPLDSEANGRSIMLTVQSVSESVMNERQLAAAGRIANRARRRAEALVRLTQLVNASFTTSDLMRVVTEEAAAFFEASHAAVLLLPPGSDSFQIGHSIGLAPGADAHKRLSYTQTLAGQALAMRRTMVVTKQAEQGMSAPTLDDGAVPAMIVCSPIWQEDRNYGVVEVYFTEAHDIPLDARTLLATFADQTAIALHKADLYEQIAQGRRQLELIVDNAPVGIAYLDPSGNVVAANAAAAQKYGTTTALLVGSHYTAFLTDLPFGVFATALGGTPFHASHSVFQRPGGEEIVCDLSLLPIYDDSSRVTGALLLTFDITDLVTAQREANVARDAAENALAQVRAAQAQMLQIEKMRAIGELASGVAHDFNNALMAILGYAELALESLDDTEAVQSHIEVIQKAAGDATSTVQRLQQFAKQRVGTYGQPVDVNSIVKDVVQLTRPNWRDAAQKEGRTFGVTLDLHRVPVVMAEQSGLREVLINLIHNALNAMPDGGDLVLATRKRGEHEVEIEVQDSGIGMSPEVVTRIFDPFFTTRGVEGTGLGLAVSWSIIQKHGGTIDVESQPGKGSRFYVRLPVSETQQAPVAPKGSVAPAATPGVRVLVVDDEPVVASVLTSILTRHGYRVTTSHSAKEALERIEEADPPFELVLTDHGMPGMNGLQMVAEIKRRWSTLPVLLLTGWGETLLQTHVAEALPDTVLGKPINQSDLLDAVGRVLRARSAAASS